jgi:hypothetical protein
MRGFIDRFVITRGPDLVVRAKMRHRSPARPKRTAVGR